MVGVKVALKPLQNIIGALAMVTVGLAAVATLHVFEMALTQPEALLVT